MPLFFFHLRTPDGLDRDDAGLEWLDLETAYLEACRAIPGMAAELIGKGVDPMRHAFEIADANDNPLLEVPFNETMRDTRKLPPPDPASPSLQIDRADDLIATTQRQIAALQEQVRASREWVRRTREDIARKSRG